MLMVEEQETRLRELGFSIRNTFLQDTHPHLDLDCPLRRAISDPTSSWSSSLSSRTSSTRVPQQTESEEEELMTERWSLAPEEWRNLKVYAALRGMAPADILSLVPLDAGRLTSVGSQQHLVGQCRPCAYFAKAGHQLAEDAASCAQGILCRFCHLEHAATKKIRMRPSPARRLQMRKMIQSFAQAKEHETAGNLVVGDVVHVVTLPPGVHAYPRADPGRALSL
mmetsp:Transcript_106959/g.276657  ORF Transcript_106959/g.276657 Transcript_106959/m.276657 type:complete len:224 (-) Transcript_106959:92-763(-)